MRNVFIDQGQNRIVYEESVWTGNKRITINGLELPKINKKTFIYNEKQYKIKGGYLSGVKLISTGTEVVIVPKLKGWEQFLVMMNFVLVAGGVVGALLGVFGAYGNATILRKTVNGPGRVFATLGIFFGALLAYFIISIPLVLYYMSILQS